MRAGGAIPDSPQGAAPGGGCVARFRGQQPPRGLVGGRTSQYPHGDGAPRFSGCGTRCRGGCLAGRGQPAQDSFGLRPAPAQKWHGHCQRGHLQLQHMLGRACRIFPALRGKHPVLQAPWLHPDPRAPEKARAELGGGAHDRVGSGLAVTHSHPGVPAGGGGANAWAALASSWHRLSRDGGRSPGRPGLCGDERSPEVAGRRRGSHGRSAVQHHGAGKRGQLPGQWSFHRERFAQ
mmetsp:Transcript_13860/g.43396  ORF Transcript_13860/g.43396 Transcript_13860/m.43396 type:complete len:235 (+) Transcript_13860:85-789(+)